MVLNRAWYWANFNTWASSHHLSPAGYKCSEPLRPQQLGGRHTWATACPPCQALGGRLLSCKTLALEGSPRYLGSRKPQGGQTQPGDPSSLLGPQANTSQPDKYHTQKSRSASAGPQEGLGLWIHPHDGWLAGAWDVPSHLPGTQEGREHIWTQAASASASPYHQTQFLPQP